MKEGMNKISLRVNIVLNRSNQSWIIEKIAHKLSDNLRLSGDEVTISETPVDGGDVVHHMSWAFARHLTSTPSTMFITHLDDIYKVGEVKDTLAKMVDVGICMSRDTMNQLLDHGAPASSVTFVNPAHDGVSQPRRTVIGLTTRVYPDGRKRESILLEVARRMSLEGFEFQIYGAGWDAAIVELEAAGARVLHYGESDDFRSDYDRIIEGIQRFDYYLYLGLDEGSLGTLDALSAGVPTIVTPQGFHLDARDGITHPIVTADDLERVFREIDQPRRQRQASVAGWTWAAYAERHREIWHALVAGSPPPPPTSPDWTIDASAAREIREATLYANALSPRRILSALSHTSLLAGLRRVLPKGKF